MEVNVQRQLMRRSDVAERYWVLQGSDKSGREVV